MGILFSIDLIPLIDRVTKYLSKYKFDCLGRDGGGGGYGTYRIHIMLGLLDQVLDSKKSAKIMGNSHKKEYHILKKGITFFDNTHN